MQAVFYRVLAGMTAAGMALAIFAQADRKQAGTSPSGRPAPEPAPPYTAEYKVSIVHTLANGKTMTEEWTELEAVDSEGRRLTVTHRPPRRGETEPVAEYHLYDPVAWTNTYWSVPGLHQAKEEKKLPSGSDRLPCPGTESAGDNAASESPQVEPAKPAPKPASSQARPLLIEQDLGIRSFHGIEAHGTREVFPPQNGESSGSSVELWFTSAPGMRGILALSSDGFSKSRMVRELLSVTVGEPGMSFFQPPQDYEIVKTEEIDRRCPSVTRPAQNAAAPAQ